MRDHQETPGAPARSRGLCGRVLPISWADAAIRVRQKPIAGQAIDASYAELRSIAQQLRYACGRRRERRSHFLKNADWTRSILREPALALNSRASLRSCLFGTSFYLFPERLVPSRSALFGSCSRALHRAQERLSPGNQGSRSVCPRRLID